MELVSRLFRGDLKLRACLNNNNDHISLKVNNKGNHVFKIQKALFRLDGLVIDSSEVRTTTYGISTADAVLSFKTKRTIINPAYQRTPDNIVGIKTIGRLDQEIFAQERGDPFSPDLLTHAPPDYEAQIRPNSCWAACLVMWRRAEVASTFTQVAYINSAPNLEESNEKGSNLNFQFLGYLFKLLLEVPIDLQAPFKSCDGGVHCWVFKTTGELAHFLQS